jgi:nitrite reductase/ring-hydroxylating ferredoxin subunit
MRDAGATAGSADTGGTTGMACAAGRARTAGAPGTARAPNARVDNALPTRLCHLSDLPDGGSRGFDPFRRGRDTVFAVRQGAAVRVWADRCPHHGTPMPWRKDAYLNAAGDRIVCSAHGALFEPATGLCVQGPCLGERLRALPCTLTDDGELLLLDARPQDRSMTPGDNP